MKKISSLLALFVISSQLTGQITLDHAYMSNAYITLTKLHVSGYKYTQLDLTNSKIYIYNTNHSVFKTITLPALTNPILKVYYISENLFDLDNQVEFAFITNAPGSFVQTFYIYKEDGTQLFKKDSASISITSPMDYNLLDGIYFDGTSTKMKLSAGSHGANARTEIYTLPGYVPCSVCSTGTVTGLQKTNNNTDEEALFYPNPVSDQLKLKYNLPQDTKKAYLKITDIQGKLMEEYQITNAFDFMYVPSNYNDGLYFYSLIVDGKTIKTEKIVLNKN